MTEEQLSVIREQIEILNSVPCTFSMCAGPEAGWEDCLTCSVCAVNLNLRALLESAEVKA